MDIQTEVFNAYKTHIVLNTEENRAGALAVKEALVQSPLWKYGRTVKTVQIPKIYNEATIERFREIVTVSCRIFEKVIREYREHADYRRLFAFPKALEELILLPPQYDGFLPIARLDLFYHEDTGEFQFCEINTDGTAAMLKDYELQKALIHNPAHRAVSEVYNLRPFELFDTWVNTFLSLYDTYPKKKERPHVAIVDFLENGSLAEFEEFARRFQKAGISCEICDIRALRYSNGRLYSESGDQIDAIYRRAVTADVMSHYGEVTDFLNAVRDDAVFLVGAFSTQLIHTKWLFYVLYHARTMAFLTKEEQLFIQEHVPFTVEFASEYISLETVLTKKDAFILKPMDAYASKGVYAAGRDHEQASWERIARDLYGKGYICQQYCEQYFTDNIDFAWGDGEWRPYMTMPGLYAYNGVFSGVLLRMGCGGNTIKPGINERTVPVLTAHGRRDGQ